MYELFTQLMAGFNPAEPIPYICGFLLFLVLAGCFFRFLYALFRPY